MPEGPLTTVRAGKICHLSGSFEAGHDLMYGCSRVQAKACGMPTSKKTGMGLEREQGKGTGRGQEGKGRKRQCQRRTILIKNRQ